MNLLIEKYKKIRKRGMIQKKYIKKYAFVGIGNHSINNLYPVLNYLKVDLKYIIAKSKDTLKLIEENFEGVIATSDLDLVLNDPEIIGVFVSTNPHSHFTIAKQALQKNKFVFIEKPPCSSLKELKELEEKERNSNAQVLTGLQRRFSPVYDILKSKIKKTNYYTLKHKTGAYPEGDELLDLFIHPLDAVFYLFGPGECLNVSVVKTKNTITYLGQIKHQNGIVGSVEFSTDYSWTTALDQLMISTEKGEYVTENTSKLTFTTKPKVLLNVPLEKISKFIPQTSILYEQNGFLPVKEHNQLYSAGYYNEIDDFMQLSEKGASQNKSNLKSLVDTFKAIEFLKEKREGV